MAGYDRLMQVVAVAIVMLSVVIGYCVCDISGFYADNGLQQTVAVKKLGSKEKRNMQQQILNLLGLEHPPKAAKTRKDFSAPRFMMDLYKTIDEDSSRRRHYRSHRLRQFNASDDNLEEIENADMVMSFMNKVDNSKLKKQERDKRFFFDFKGVPIEDSVTTAELHFFKRRSHKYEGKQFTMLLYRFSHGSVKEKDHITLRLEANRTFPIFTHGWMKINITGAATFWLRNPAENYGLHLSVVDETGEEIEPHHAGLVGRRGPEDKQPFMVASFKTEDDLISRNARTTWKKSKSTKMGGNDMPYGSGKWNYGRMTYHNKYSVYNHQVCQKRTLYVGFKDLNWQDWIIAPEGYSAFYCYGECAFPLNAHMNATNHAIMQTLVHSMKPLLVPKPGCAPTKLSAISVLYFDEEYNVILKKYRNMSVRSCGCH